MGMVSLSKSLHMATCTVNSGFTRGCLRRALARSSGPEDSDVVCTRLR